MRHYDPEAAPEPVEWLALDEQERIELVAAHHQAARINLPNVQMHAATHVIVENQIAESFEPTVRAMARLANQGLSRHDAVHAIGCVVTEHLFETLNSKAKDTPDTIQARLNAAIERLSAKEWRKRYVA